MDRAPVEVVNVDRGLSTGQVQLDAASIDFRSAVLLQASHMKRLDCVLNTGSCQQTRQDSGVHEACGHFTIPQTESEGKKKNSEDRYQEKRIDDRPKLQPRTHRFR